jgi:glutathione S-transferase
MKGEQNQEFFLKLNPLHTIPTLCDANGNGIWESGAILRHLAGLANEKVTDKVNMALDWRQTT